MSTPKTFSQRVSNIRERLGLTQTELAKTLGISRNYVSMIEGGREPSEALAKLIETLEASPDSANRLNEDVTPYRFNRQAPHTPEIYWARVISWTHAGEAQSYEELPEHWQDTIPITIQSEKAFGLIVDGDSMEPRCVAGDVVVVLPDREAANGNLVVAKLKDDGIQLRRFTRLRKDVIRLSAYNPVYPPSEHHPTDFHWIYPVHSTIRRELR